MTFRTGIDIVEIRRVGALMEKFGDRFVVRHFTEREICYCRSKTRPAIHFAGRLAAKEAVFKALGLNWQPGFSWKNIEILDEGAGYPAAILSNSFREHLEKSEFSRIEISISHTGEYAAATALVWG